MKGVSCLRNLVRVARIVSRKLLTKTSQSLGWPFRQGGRLCKGLFARLIQPSRQIARTPSTFNETVHSPARAFPFHERGLLIIGAVIIPHDAVVLASSAEAWLRRVREVHLCGEV